MTQTRGAVVHDNPPQTPSTCHVYCDGACIGNPGPMGAGVVILGSDSGIAAIEISDYLGTGTNNIAELTAVERGLRDLPRREPVIVYTDSSYTIGVLAGGFKAKANQQLVARIKKLLAEFQVVYFKKVKGHSGVTYNERADVLANMAAQHRSTRPQVTLEMPRPAEPPAAPAEPKLGAEGVQEIALRILGAMHPDPASDAEAHPLSGADGARIKQSYKALVESGQTLKGSARAARLEWLNSVLAASTIDRKLAEFHLLQLLVTDMPVKAEAAVRRAYRALLGSDAFNESWLAAYEKDGEAAVMAFQAAVEALEGAEQ